MATFLVTPRMNPELRARVERAVSSRVRARYHAAGLGLKSPLAGRTRRSAARLLPLLALLVVGGLFTAVARRDKRELEASRGALLAELDGLRAGLPPGHEGLIAETDRWLVEAAAEGHAGELIDATLRPAGALDATLNRPALYVRAPAAALGDARAMGGAVQGSDKDAFLVCLLHPPASTSERDLLTKVRGVYFAGAKVDDETANVRRLAEVRLGLAVLAPAFEGSVRAAEDRNALNRLRQELSKAPVELAKRAARAEILIIVADSDAGARVTVVDLAAKKPLFRVHRRVEARSWSEKAFIYTEQLEACSLAVAVRRAVTE